LELVRGIVDAVRLPLGSFLAVLHLHTLFAVSKLYDMFPSESITIVCPCPFVFAGGAWSNKGLVVPEISRDQVGLVFHTSFAPFLP